MESILYALKLSEHAKKSYEAEVLFESVFSLSLKENSEDNAEALYRLGLLVASGKEKKKGYVVNLVFAKNSFEKSAAQNFVPAQFILAVCYGIGLGCTKDIATAYSWYEKAFNGSKLNRQGRRYLDDYLDLKVLNKNDFEIKYNSRGSNKNLGVETIDYFCEKEINILYYGDKDLARERGYYSEKRYGPSWDGIARGGSSGMAMGFHLAHGFANLSDYI